jgi:hypothetical protein
MKTNNIFSLIALGGMMSFVAISCKKSEEEINPNDKNSVFLTFDNRVGDKAMTVLTTYKNGSGEDFTITTFNYFISNISLKKEDGTFVKFPNQYFLIRQVDDKTFAPQLKDVPAGNYKEITFSIGVDSIKSISDVSERKGVLDPTSYGEDGMYWSWNSGYIFMKMEGISSFVPTRADGKKLFAIHVGGFGGKTSVVTNNLRTVNLPFPSIANVRANVSPELHVAVDAMQIFDGKNKIKLVETNSVHSPSVAAPIADNFLKMFSIDNVRNDVK